MALVVNESESASGLDEVLALDIGGTKLAAGVVDAAGLLRDRRVIATERTAGAPTVLGHALGLVEELAAASADPVFGAGVHAASGNCRARSGIPALARTTLNAAVKSGPRSCFPPSAARTIRVPWLDAVTPRFLPVRDWLLEDAGRLCA